VAAFGLLVGVARATTFPRGDGCRRRKASWLTFLRYAALLQMSNVDSLTANQRAGLATARRDVFIKLPQSETVPQRTIVIEELSA
jgi:hypothetical protein